MVYNEKVLIQGQEKFDKLELKLFKEILKNEIMLQALGEIETYKAVDMPVRHVAARALREVNEI